MTDKQVEAHRKILDEVLADFPSLGEIPIVHLWHRESKRANQAEAERDRYREQLDTATAEIRTLRDALKTAIDDNRYRAALRRAYVACSDSDWVGALMVIEGLDPSEFDE